MKKALQGFTVIEVMLFLAISGLLFTAIIVGTNTALARQRYNESVQNFSEFFKTIYSKVANVENNEMPGGVSERAIYGKLITFSERLNLEGQENSNGDIFVYDVIGDVSDAMGGKDVLQGLKGIGADVIRVSNSQSIYAGIHEAYNTRWSATIETPTAGEKFKGAILIVRSAVSGTIYTYNYDGKNQMIEVNQAVHSAGTQPSGLLSNFLNSFVLSDVDFCVNSGDSYVYGGRRQNVRLIQGARNSSGVQIVPLDEAENRC